MKLQLVDISDKEFDIMHESCLTLLQKYGVLFDNESARGLLVKAGNTVDENGRVHFKPRFVESMLRLVPKDGFTMYGRDETKRLRVAVDCMSFRPSTGEPFVLDYATRERREATMSDAEALVRITDSLDGFGMVNSVVNVRDAPGTWKEMLHFILSHRYSLKPSDITVSTVGEVHAIARIASAIRGSASALRERPLTAVHISMISPLRCSNEQAEAFMESARLGLPVEILSSPAMGMSSPVTLSGSVVVSLSEVLAAICLLYQIAPGLGVINASRVSPINMRTGSYNYGAPELGMGSALTSACSARYHIATNVYGFGSSAQSAGIQSEMEKIFSGLLVALGRTHMITGSGILDNSLVTSPELLVIDHEAIRFITRIRKPIIIDEDAIGIDVLIKGMQESGSLIAEEHTLKYLKDGELLDCSLDQWESLEKWQKEGKPDLLDKAHKKVEDILARHSIEPLEPSIEKEIEKARLEFSHP